MDLQTIKGVAFDLDGTIYLGDNLIDGAVEVILFFRNLNKKICFFTNSSLRTKNQTAMKLKKLGIRLSDEDEVLTSAYAAAFYMRKEGIKCCYCIGSQGLIEEIQNQNIKISDKSEEIEAVILGLDPEFNYDKLETVLNLQSGNNLRIIACNLDKSYPVKNGLKPGTGPIAAAVSNVTGKPVEDIGKPNTYMLEMLSRRWDLSNYEILIIGDSFDSDIRMAIKYNSPSILISAGKDLTDNDRDKMVVVSQIGEIISLFNNI